MSAWESFFVAEVGASAVLAGLIFVGISMNLRQLLARRLVSRAAWVCLLSLVEVLVVSSYMLIPEQSRRLLGVEVGVTGLACWVVITTATATQLGVSGKEGWAEGQRWFAKAGIVALSQVITVPFVVGGVMLGLDVGSGVYWVVAGVLSALPYSLYMGWVLTVEVNR